MPVQLIDRYPEAPASEAAARAQALAFEAGIAELWQRVASGRSASRELDAACGDRAIGSESLRPGTAVDNAANGTTSKGQGTRENEDKDGKPAVAARHASAPGEAA